MCDVELQRFYVEKEIVQQFVDFSLDTILDRFPNERRIKVHESASGERRIFQFYALLKYIEPFIPISKAYLFLRATSKLEDLLGTKHIGNLTIDDPIITHGSLVPELLCKIGDRRVKAFVLEKPSVFLSDRKVVEDIITMSRWVQDRLERGETELLNPVLVIRIPIRITELSKSAPGNKKVNLEGEILYCFWSYINDVTGSDTKGKVSISKQFVLKDPNSIKNMISQGKLRQLKALQRLLEAIENAVVTPFEMAPNR